MKQMIGDVHAKQGVFPTEKEREREKQKKSERVREMEDLYITMLHTRYMSCFFSPRAQGNEARASLSEGLAEDGKEGEKEEGKEGERKRELERERERESGKGGYTYIYIYIYIYM